MRRIFILIICAVLILLGNSASAKTLVVYYSYTGNCRDIVATLTSQIEADVLEIQPAEKGQKYEANGRPYVLHHGCNTGNGSTSK